MPMMPMPSSRRAYTRSGWCRAATRRGRAMLPRHIPPMKVPAEDHPLAVGRDGHVRFEPVVVPGHVHQPLPFQLAVGLGAEEVNPPAVLGEGHLAGVAAVPGEQLAVVRDVVVDRPLIP